jgi:hypothetical protein
VRWNVFDLNDGPEIGRAREEGTAEEGEEYFELTTSGRAEAWPEAPLAGTVEVDSEDAEEFDPAEAIERFLESKGREVGSVECEPVGDDRWAVTHITAG